MKAAIMQPYFLPYLGYFQLAAMVDQFVIYDNIKYTKKGWINRNRILTDGKEHIITIPIKKGSDYLDIKARLIADDFNLERKKMINLVAHSYRRAPEFNHVFPLFEHIINYKSENLFDFLRHSLSALFDFMRIKTRLLVSSEITADHSLHGADRVIEICRSIGADTYINPIGGLELYSKDLFNKNSIDLKFHNMQTVPYTQSNGVFVSHLSILDVLMYNNYEKHALLLSQFELI